MPNLSHSELRKRPERPAIFIRKLKEKELFELTGGKKVVLVYAKGVEKILEKGTSKEIHDLRFIDGKGGIYKITDFVKNADFGGKVAHAGTVHEDAQLESLRAQINAVKLKEARSEITVRVGNRDYKCADVVSTTSKPDPKSDFQLIDVNGKETVWISHKDGKTPKDFQQWGGMSKVFEPIMHNHEESRMFIEDLSRTFPNGLESTWTIARKIIDKALQMRAVYGNQFGGPLGRQNVTLVLQGPVILKKSGSKYIIEAYHTHVNGETIGHMFAPTFMASYRLGRNDSKIKNSRIGISPIGGRPITHMI